MNINRKKCHSLTWWETAWLHNTFWQNPYWQTLWTFLPACIRNQALQSGNNNSTSWKLALSVLSVPAGDLDFWRHVCCYSSVSQQQDVRSLTVICHDMLSCETLNVFQPVVTWQTLWKVELLSKRSISCQLKTFPKCNEIALFLSFFHIFVRIITFLVR